MIHLGLVINPTAGRGRGTQAGRRVHELLRARGHKVEDLSAATLAQATDRARAAAVQGLDALVVVGGDGMVHLGVNVVAGTGLPLGIVAAGTGNDIARTLGLPRGDAEASVAAVEHGLLDGPRRVDAVRVGSPEHAAHEWYLGVLSCGFDAAINARANEMTWPKGSGRYVRALAAELGRFRPYGYRVTLDDSVWESAGTLVAVANMPWIGGGLKIAPDARHRRRAARRRRRRAVHQAGGREDLPGHLPGQARRPPRGRRPPQPVGAHRAAHRPRTGPARRVRGR